MSHIYTECGALESFYFCLGLTTTFIQVNEICLTLFLYLLLNFFGAEGEVKIMNIFKNDYLPLEKGFVELYGDICSKLFDETIREVYHIAFTADPINSGCDNTPFCCCLCARDGVRQIAYNSKLIKHYELTKEEQFAFIAHEIGHILMVHYNDRTEDYILKEVKADDVAIKLGLKESLLSGLRKIKELNLECIEERIRIIEEQK